MEEKLSPRARECFLERWGDIVRGHGLRNPQLRAAPDYGWMLDLNGASNPAAFAEKRSWTGEALLKHSSGP